MKIRLVSEQTPGGRAVDWPAAPSVGDIVSYDYDGGVRILEVTEVRWVLDADGNLVQVDVYLAR